MDLKTKPILVIVLAGITAALTLMIRIPIPGTGGYLNMGDSAVVFCGLFLGGWWGALAGGLGSASADLFGGFFIFAPVTFIAKGFEGLIAGTLGRKNIYWVILAVLTMVVIYFVAEVFLPGMGLTAAVSELPFNVVQALVGGFAGVLVHRGVKIAFTPAVKA
jgi:uncharacterized membrane protein